MIDQPERVPWTPQLVRVLAGLMLSLVACLPLDPGAISGRRFVSQGTGAGDGQGLLPCPPFDPAASTPERGVS